MTLRVTKYLMTSFETYVVTGVSRGRTVTYSASTLSLERAESDISGLGNTRRSCSIARHCLRDGLEGLVGAIRSVAWSDRDLAVGNVTSVPTQIRFFTVMQGLCETGILMPLLFLTKSVGGRCDGASKDSSRLRRLKTSIRPLLQSSCVRVLSDRHCLQGTRIRGE
jgi:hypothetical protein